MNQRIKKLADAQKQVKLVAKTHGRASQQYQDAVKHWSDLVVGQMKGLNKNERTNSRTC
jgi:hypothetical protein